MKMVDYDRSECIREGNGRGPSDVFAACRHSCTDSSHEHWSAISAVNRYLRDNIPSNRFRHCFAPNWIRTGGRTFLNAGHNAPFDRTPPAQWNNWFGGIAAGNQTRRRLQKCAESAGDVLAFIDGVTKPPAQAGKSLDRRAPSGGAAQRRCLSCRHSRSHRIGADEVRPGNTSRRRYNAGDCQTTGRGHTNGSGRSHLSVALERRLQRDLQGKIVGRQDA